MQQSTRRPTTNGAAITHNKEAEGCSESCIYTAFGAALFAGGAQVKPRCQRGWRHAAYGTGRAYIRFLF